MAAALRRPASCALAAGAGAAGALAAARPLARAPLLLGRRAAGGGGGCPALRGRAVCQLLPPSSAAASASAPAARRALSSSSGPYDPLASSSSSSSSSSSPPSAEPAPPSEPSPSGGADAGAGLASMPGASALGRLGDEVGRLLLRLCPMPVVHALAKREAARKRARALQEEGPAMAEVTALGRTAFLASRARRAEELAPEPLFAWKIEDLFHSTVFEAALARARLPLLARAAKDGVSASSSAEADEEEMPPWLGIGSSTAYFDQRVEEALASGTRQVVVLGSGLDTRAMRLPRPLGEGGERVLFVEVDEGPLLDFKVGRLARVGLQPYPALLLKGNYLKMSLVKDLLALGVDPSLPVFFLWEANTMYLPPAECRAFLGSLLSAFPKCTVSFDYFTEPVAGPGGPKPTGCAETDRELEIVVRAIGDGEWLLIGPWDAALSKQELGYEVIEDLSLPDVIHMVRDKALAEDLLAKHHRDFEVGLHACQRFCLVRPGAGAAAAAAAAAGA